MHKIAVLAAASALYAAPALAGDPAVMAKQNAANMCLVLHALNYTKSVESAETIAKVIVGNCRDEILEVKEAALKAVIRKHGGSLASQRQEIVVMAADQLMQDTALMMAVQAKAVGK